MGRIGKPHGVRGWVTVTPTTDDPDRRFTPGATVILGGEARTVAESRMAPRIALRLAGCTSREQAEALRGEWMYVVADLERPADPDEFYDHQLEGLGVLVDGARIGVVGEVLHLPGQDVLAVVTDGRQVLVPFVAELVPSVDLVAGVVEVAAIEGLIDDAD